MKKFRVSSSVFWGIVLVLAAVGLVLDGAGITLAAGLAWYHYAFGALLLGWIIYELIRLHFARTVFPLAFLFLLFEGPICAWTGKGENGNLISNWTVLLAAALLYFGLAAIFQNSRFERRKKFGESTMYVDAADLRSCRIADNLGRVQVYVTNPERYRGDGIITVIDNVGNVMIHLPDNWQVITQSTDNLGHVDVPPQFNVSGPAVTLQVSDNVGLIKVVYN